MTNRSLHLFSVSLAMSLAGSAAFAQSSDEASSAPPSGQEHCRQRVVLPIGGQLGQDGAWHESRSPVAAPAVGGGPCEPETPSAAPSDQTAASAAPSSTLSNRGAPEDSAQAAAVQTAPAATPIPSRVRMPDTVVATQPATVLVRPAAPIVVAAPVGRGGGPYVVPAPDVYYMPPRPVPPPRIARWILGAGFGTGLYTLRPAANDLGLAWHADAGIEIARIVSIEARYMGSSNQVPTSIDANGGFGAVSNGVAGLLRLAIPTPYVRPYVQGGIGYLWFAPTGGATTTSQFSFPTGLAQVPVGGGIEIRPAPVFGIDLEYNYQFLVDHGWNFDQRAHPWGDLWNANVALRFYL